MTGRFESLRAAGGILLSLLLCLPASASVLGSAAPTMRTIAYVAGANPQIALGASGLTISWFNSNPPTAQVATSSDNGGVWTLHGVASFPGTSGALLLPRTRTRGLEEMPGGDRILLGTDFQEMALLRSADAGATWTKQSLAYVPPVSNFVSTTIGDGKVWSDGSRVLFFYTAGVTTGFTSREVRMRASNDGGTTFAPEIVIATLPSDYLMGLLRLSVEGDRIRLLIWSPFSPLVFLTSSNDGGATWTPLLQLANDAYTRADPVNQSEHVVLASSGNRVFIGYTDPSFSFHLLRSSDGGASVDLSQTIPQDASFDLRQGAQIVALDTNHLVLFYSARKYSAFAGRGVFDLYAQESTDGGSTWSTPLALTSSDDVEEVTMGSVLYDAAGSRILLVATASEFVDPFRARILWTEFSISNAPVSPALRYEFPAVPAVVTVDSITVPGSVTLTRDTAGPNPGSLYPVTSRPYLHLSTTATTSGGVTIEVNLAPDALPAGQARRVRIYAWDGFSWVYVMSSRIDGETITARLPGFAGAVDLLLAVEPIRWNVNASPSRIRVDKPGDVDFIARSLDGYLPSDVDPASVRVDAIVPFQVKPRDGNLRARVWKSDFVSYPRNTLLSVRMTGRMFDGTPCVGSTIVMTEDRASR